MKQPFGYTCMVLGTLLCWLWACGETDNRPPSEPTDLDPVLVDTIASNSLEAAEQGQDTIAPDTLAAVPVVPKVSLKRGVRPPQKVIELDTLNYYVFPWEGTPARKYALPRGKVEEHLSYGVVFRRVGEEGDWHQMLRRADTLYVAKEEAVLETEIPLSKEDLNQGTFPYDEVNSTQFLRIDPISRAQYYAQKPQNRRKDLVSNPAVTQKDGILRLPIQDSVLTFEDQDDGYSVTDYSYLGDLPSLNVYVVNEMCQECEDDTYALIDRTTGDTYAMLGSLPNLAPDQKTFIELSSTYSNEIADNHALIALYRLGDSLQLVAAVEYPLWCPSYYETGYWGEDGAYYAAALPAIANWEYNGIRRDTLKGTCFNCRFVRISLSDTEYWDEE